jgi:hypothetical protein
MDAVLVLPPQSAFQSRAVRATLLDRHSLKVREQFQGYRDSSGKGGKGTPGGPPVNSYVKVRMGEFVREILNRVGTQDLCEDLYGIHVLDNVRVCQSLPLEFSSTRSTMSSVHFT